MKSLIILERSRKKSRIRSKQCIGVSLLCRQIFEWWVQIPSYTIFPYNIIIPFMNQFLLKHGTKNLVNIETLLVNTFWLCIGMQIVKVENLTPLFFWFKLSPIYFLVYYQNEILSCFEQIWFKVILKKNFHQNHWKAKLFTPII